jgi:hypothetical protein
MTQNGLAMNTAFVQQWLNSCEAVTTWHEINADLISFEYTTDAEVTTVPHGVWFDPDQASEEIEIQVWAADQEDRRGNDEIADLIEDLLERK